MTTHRHVIVGAGVAGLACAIEAARGGVRTLLLDREPVIGGTLWHSSGHMSGAGTRRQRALGIGDDPARHLAEVERLGRGLVTPSLMRRAVEGAAETLDWLEDEGFETAPGMPIIAKSHEPYEIRRTLWGVAGGLSILKVLHRQLARPEIRAHLEIRPGVEVAEIDLDADPVRITTRGGDVIAAHELTLATGGFGASPELLKAWQGQEALYGGGAFADGAVMKLLVAQGAEIVGAGTFLPTLGGYAQAPDTNLIDWARKLTINPQQRRVPEVFLDAQGRRFINEHSESIDGVERTFLRHGVDRYFVLGSFATLARAAPLIGGEGASVERQRALIAGIEGARIGTLDQVLAGRDDFAAQVRQELALSPGATDRFGRDWAEADLLAGEVYLIPCQTVVLRTWPGIRVDDAMRLVRNGASHPHVRCLGEMLGGVQFSGASFASGMSLTPALTLARALGKSLAEQEPRP